MKLNSFTATPRATPRGFETPSGATPLGQGGSATPSHNPLAPPSSSLPADPAAPEPGQPNVNMSLDTFIIKHTSEDDASYPTSNLQRKKWLFDPAQICYNYGQTA